MQLILGSEIHPLFGQHIVHAFSPSYAFLRLEKQLGINEVPKGSPTTFSFVKVQKEADSTSKSLAELENEMLDRIVAEVEPFATYDESLVTGSVNRVVGEFAALVVQLNRGSNLIAARSRILAGDTYIVSEFVADRLEKDSSLYRLLRDEGESRKTIIGSQLQFRGYLNGKSVFVHLDWKPDHSCVIVGRGISQEAGVGTIIGKRFDSLPAEYDFYLHPEWQDYVVVLGMGRT